MTQHSEHGRGIVSGAVALAAMVVLAACGDGTGPAGTGEARVVMSSTDGSASMVASSSSSDPVTAAQVTLDQVSSITVDVNRVEVLPAGTDTTDGGPWVSVSVTTQTVDLMDLGASGVEIAAGEISAGDYRNVRFFFEDATITFSEEVTFGGGQNAETYAAGEAHPLIIPSGDQTGVKVPGAEFTVEEDATGTVVVEFDPAASVQNVNLSARGVMMAPVLTAGGEGGNGSGG